MTKDVLSTALFVVPVLSIFLWNQSRRKKNDSYYLQRAQKLRLALDKPLHSRFRVVALLLLEDGSIVFGTNDEPSPSIGGAICAERAAFLSLKVQHPSNQQQKIINTIYIVTDADHPVPPGMLCREYMSGHCATRMDTTRIVLQSAEVDSEPWIVTLQELYPYPSLYNRLSVEEQLRIGKEWDWDVEHEIAGLNVPGLNHGQLLQLLQAAKQATEQDDHDSLHPIRYGAAVAIQTDDNKKNDIIEIQSAAQRKALEYGCSLDAVCQLACYLVEKEKALCIVQVDQYGIVHAPFAPARSFLVEHGFAECHCLVTSMQEDGPSIKVVLAESLAPYIPKF